MADRGIEETARAAAFPPALLTLIDTFQAKTQDLLPSQLIPWQTPLLYLSKSDFHTLATCI